MILEENKYPLSIYLVAFFSTILTFKEDVKTWRSFFVEVKKYVRMQPCQSDFASCFEVTSVFLLFAGFLFSSENIFYRQEYVFQKIGCIIFEQLAKVSTNQKTSSLPQCNTHEEILKIDRIISGLAMSTQR